MAYVELGRPRTIQDLERPLQGRARFSRSARRSRLPAPSPACPSPARTQIFIGQIKKERTVPERLLDLDGHRQPDPRARPSTPWRSPGPCTRANRRARLDMKDVLAPLPAGLPGEETPHPVLGCSSLVAFFTYLFVNLVQPILDKLFQPTRAPAVPAESPAHGRRLPDAPHGRGGHRPLPALLVLVVVIFGKGLFTFLSSFFMKAVGHRVVKTAARRPLPATSSTSPTSYLRPGADGRPDVPDDQRRRQDPAGHLGQPGRLDRGASSPSWPCSSGSSSSTSAWPWSPSSSPPWPSSPWPSSAASSRRRASSARTRCPRSTASSTRPSPGNKIVKAFTTEEFEIRKFLKATASYLRTSIKLAWIGSLSSPFMEFIGGGGRRLHPLCRDAADRRGRHQPGRFRRLRHGPLHDVHAHQPAQPGQQRHPAGRRLPPADPGGPRRPSPQIRDAPNAYPLPGRPGAVWFEDVSLRATTRPGRRSRGSTSR